MSNPKKKRNRANACREMENADIASGSMKNASHAGIKMAAAVDNRAEPITNQIAPVKPSEVQTKNWERVLWMMTFIGGIHLGYTTWLSGWAYINGRRDIILGIGQSTPLTKDLAYHVFYNDWLTCALSFFFYVLLFLGLFWFLTTRYKPMQVALLNPFGESMDWTLFEQRRKLLSKLVGFLVGAGILALAVTIWKDGTGTMALIETHCKNFAATQPSNTSFNTATHP